MIDSVGREIRVGDIITYAQRQGNSVGLQIAVVRALEHAKRPGVETLCVDIPTDTFSTVYRKLDGTRGTYSDLGARYVGHVKVYKQKRTMLEYSSRATVVPDRDEAWFIKKFKIGITEYGFSTKKYSPDTPCQTLEEVLEWGVSDWAAI
jgi:hypothetical protein